MAGSEDASTKKALEKGRKGAGFGRVAHLKHDSILSETSILLV
jgi:hypothetical protein